MHALPRVESSLLLTLGFMIPLSIAGSNIIWVSATAIFMVNLFYSRRKIVLTGLEGAMLFFFLTAAVSAILAEHPWLAFRALRGEVLAVVFFLSAWGGEESSVVKRLPVFLAGAGLAGALGVFQKIFSFESGFLALHAGRSVGFYSHPITFAEMLLLAAPLTLGLKFKLRWQLPLFFVLLGGVLFSQTRSVWISLVLAMAGWCCFQPNRRVWGTLGLIVLFFGFSFGFNRELRERASSVSHVNANASNKIRLGLWKKSIESIKKNPVFGVGAGHFRVPGTELSNEGSPADRVWTETHNSYLQVAVERGFFGVIGLFGVLFSLGRMLWRAGKKNPDLQGIFWGFVGLCFAGLTESWIGDSEILMCLFFLSGTVWSLTKKPALLYDSQKNAK